MGAGVARGHACPAFAKETNGSFLFFSFSPGGERQRNFSQTEKRVRVLRRLGCVPFSLHSAVMSYTLTRGGENAGATPRDSAWSRVSLVSRPFCRFLASLLLLFFFSNEPSRAEPRPWQRLRLRVAGLCPDLCPETNLFRTWRSGQVDVAGTVQCCVCSKQRGLW